ncbi:hypothetical protein [Micromonospora sicca]|nr:hypothetical protein [Micromonospora sp. 4G51]
MVQSASGAGGPPEAIITGISTRMVYRPSVSGRNRDGRAQTPAQNDGHAGGDQAGPGQDRGDTEQYVAEVPVARPDHLGRGDDELTDDRAGQAHPGDAAVATGV